MPQCTEHRSNSVIFLFNCMLQYCTINWCPKLLYHLLRNSSHNACANFMNKTDKSCVWCIGNVEVHAFQSLNVNCYCNFANCQYEKCGGFLYQGRSFHFWTWLTFSLFTPISYSVDCIFLINRNFIFADFLSSSSSQISSICQYRCP